MLAPLRGEDGGITHLIPSGVLISDRKKTEAALRESEERLHLALGAASMGVWARDYVRGDAYWSPELCRMLGMEEFDGRPERISELVASEDAEMIQRQVREALASGGQFRAEFAVHLPDGQVRWMSSRGRAHYDESGRPTRMFGVTADVTERRLAEEELQRAKAAAEAASRAKDEFLAALSHELRTPLNPVLLLASELEQSEAVPADLREDFSLIRKNIELEARLIDDLLDLTAVTQNKLQLQRVPTDLHGIVRQALEMVSAEAEAKRMNVRLALVADDARVWGDAVRLQQVVWNVLRNAFKFTPEGGQISVITSNPEPGCVRLSVTDSGFGMTPDELQAVFDAFFQGKHAETPRFGGLGLGLAIARRLTELHGGQVRARSDGRHCGSTFDLEFPLLGGSGVDAAFPGKKATSGEPGRLPEAGRRLLLVEDHASTRDTLARLLRRRGHHVTEADSVAAALAEAEGGAFDLVISDVGLADGSGHELMEQLAVRFGLRGVSLSGYGMEKDVASSLRAGFAVHLTKPVGIDELEEAIRKALG